MHVSPRPSEERGQTRLAWLDSQHAFAFGDYRDPDWPGFRGLRVLNEDVVAPGRGFGPHPHRHAEILSFVLAGALRHEDSLGARSEIHAGEVQAMSAGPGVVHAEWNASDREPVHFVQVWLLPDRPVATPAFAHATPGWRAHHGLTLVASPDARDGSLPIHADASVYAGRLAAGEGLEFAVGAGRAVWVQGLAGSLTVANRTIDAGDALGIEAIDTVSVQAREDAEFLLFDLA